MAEKFPNIQRMMLFTLLGVVIGVTGGLSLLRTNWIGYQIDFFFWWSIVSTIAGLLLIVFSVWQYWEGKSQLEKNKAQVKVWMQDANGISQALNRIVVDNLQKRFSTTDDVCNAVWAVHASAFALYQSLYEERCVTEEEYKDGQKKLMTKLEAQEFANTKVNQPKTE